jgi:hypothetical protein
MPEPVLKTTTFSSRLRLFEIARVLVHLNHIASLIVNANHGIMRPAEELRVFLGVGQRENRRKNEYSLGTGWNWGSKIHDGLEELKDDL